MPEPIPLILALETATSVCSIALLEGKSVIGERNEPSHQRHNEILPEMVQSLFEDSKKSFRQLSFVAVSIGPGSFSGLRVGLSFAKGICVSTNTGLIPVDTLHGLALAIFSHCAEPGQTSPKSGSFAPGETILPVTIARKHEIFGRIFRIENNSVLPAADSEVFLGGSDKLLTHCVPPVRIGGPGIETLPYLMDTKNLPDGIVPEKNISASAAKIGILAFEKYLENPQRKWDFSDLEPKYMSEFTVRKRSG